MRTTVVTENGRSVELSAGLASWHFELMGDPSVLLAEGSIPLDVIEVADGCVELTGRLPLEGSATIRDDVKVEARRCPHASTFAFHVIRTYEGGWARREVACAP